VGSPTNLYPIGIISYCDIAFISEVPVFSLISHTRTASRNSSLPWQFNTVALEIKIKKRGISRYLEAQLAESRPAEAGD